MNLQYLQHYRELRRLGIPSQHALAYAKRRAELESTCAATGFEWRENRQGGLSARWRQEGFELIAVVVNDEDGWWTSGADCIGRFTGRWEPGAIRHRQGERNAHKWFIPANLGDPKEEYRRACAYGHYWRYVGVKVSAFRAGVALGEASLFGIEPDCRPDRQHLTETAFELASQAIGEANDTLRTLCGCH